MFILGPGSCVLLVPGLDAQGGGAPPLAAQGQQTLAFGDLLGGLARRIPPTDPADSGQFRVRLFQTTAQVSFLLPAALQRAGGGELPLSFGPGDAIFTRTGGGAGSVVFDPTVGTVISGDSTPGWSWIYIGGTVLPPTSARPGAYTGTIVLTLADLGN
ncbi:MAG: hypothetical protein EA350_14955 [Gemmatimonadales bacterium]|nr:MAG: hypothetical protein EA350_14955 [Gemmatimonadales bacterium]